MVVECECDEQGRECCEIMVYNDIRLSMPYAVFIGFILIGGLTKSSLMWLETMTDICESIEGEYLGELDAVAVAERERELREQRGQQLQQQQQQPAGSSSTSRQVD